MGLILYTSFQATSGFTELKTTDLGTAALLGHKETINSGH